MIAYGTWIIHHLPFIITGILGIGGVIAFHELGHFLFCKLFNIHVPTFSIGFGPQLLKKKYGETTFTLSLIPVGGYVEIEMGQTEAMGSHRFIDTKPYWQKLLVVCGGILFNLIFTFVVLTGLSLSGIPSNPFLINTGTWSIKKLVPNAPAQKAGIEPGDRILKINDQDVSDKVESLFKVLEPLADTAATVTFEHQGVIKTTQLTIGSQEANGKKRGMIGIEEFLFPAFPATSFLDAFVQAAQLTKKLIVSTACGFASALKKCSASNFSGPLMMFSLTIASASQGIKLFLIFLALISVTLAVLNVIPLPILDGGRIMSYSIEAIIRRPLPEKFTTFLHYASWIFMAIFFAYLTIKDLGLLF